MVSTRGSRPSVNTGSGTSSVAALADKRLQVYDAVSWSPVDEGATAQDEGLISLRMMTRVLLDTLRDDDPTTLFVESVVSIE